MSKVLVSSYKTLGVMVLIFVLVGVVGFMAKTVFYFVDNTWVKPGLISQSSSDVAQLRSTHSSLLKQSNELEIQLKELKSRNGDGTLNVSITQNRQAFASVQKGIAEIQKMPEYLAAEQDLTVIFVPYDNQSNTTSGTKLFGCDWYLLNCDVVGTTAARFPGEVSKVSPASGEPVRGFYQAVTFSDRSSVEYDVLFAGKKPFWLF